MHGHAHPDAQPNTHPALRRHDGVEASAIIIRVAASDTRTGRARRKAQQPATAP